MKRPIFILIIWILLALLLAPIALNIQSHFIYSDSPFLTNQYQSVKVENILKEYFNYTKESELFVIINGSYNKSLKEVNNSLMNLQDAKLITPYEYISQINSSYMSFISPILKKYEDNLSYSVELYHNLTLEKEGLLNNLSWFYYQLNVTFKEGHNVTPSSYVTEYNEYLEETHNPVISGVKTFNDPFILLFSENNFTNESLVKETLSSFSNYSYLIYKITGKNVPICALENPSVYALHEVESKIPPPPIGLCNFHRGNTWVFIVKVPDNESLTNVEDFMQNIPAIVTGHFAIYAQSAYYTQQDLKIIDIVTIILVGSLLIILLRSFFPIVFLIFSAIVGIEIAYSLLYLATFIGYKIYYISGLVIPPIVFGITIDYSILFMYRYFEEARKNSNTALRNAFRTAGKGAIFSGLSITIGFSSFLLSPSPLLKNIGEALIIASLSALIPAILFNYTALKTVSLRLLSFPRKDIPNPIDVRQKYLRDVSGFSIKHKFYIVGIMIILALASFAVFFTHTTTVAFNEIVPSNSETVVGERILSSYFNYSVDYIIIKGNPNLTFSKIYNLSKEIINCGGLAYGPVSFGKFLTENHTALENIYSSHNYSLVEAYVPYPVFSKGAISFTQKLINQGYMVGGSNANRIDIVNNTVSTYYSFTLLLTIILITVYISVVLRSIIVPIRLSLTLLVSSLVGVAVMFEVFKQVYWLSPLIVFALLFSLGIDYDMFIILRIKEERGSEDERIIKGITYTGLVVTAAGLILAGAFFSLISADMRFLEEIGFSVGFSVIFDTFIVRPILVPAIMSILKKYNWWPFAS
ncbi:MMPL family transporter [Acidianus sp. HS-5]|uniref:MMPL family transporter n=1 Tax=Acidianus sp. HS-5 TaxID=2886040 RepID=UPI001F011862|nr:MMPL family transporter [Acidianus sp. HS-5]BDC19453.1 antibiotic transporter [Acidianus sp. HS-5]